MGSMGNCAGTCPLKPTTQQAARITMHRLTIADRENRIESLFL
jgi:hypothetical protein